jgi:predicted metal-dependent phosphoesterase TrpH
MLKEGYINTIYEAFQKYIGNKGSCYVGRFKMKPQEVIELVLASGGIPVLAHPNDLGDDAWIPKLVDYGLKGIEAYYLEHSKAITDKYLNIAKKYNLLVTGGSDCHGFAKEQVRIGKMKIPYELVEKLKDAQSRI